MDRSIDEVNDRVKRILSTSSAKEACFKKPKTGLSNEEFCSNIPKWGGHLRDKNNNLIELINTCTIDYFLFALWTSWRLGSFDLEEDENDDLTTNIYEIIKKIEEREWNEAKSIWTTKVNMNPITNNDGCLSINTLGIEHEMFINSFVPFQEYQLKRKCSTSCERNNTIKIKKYIYIALDINNNIVLFNESDCRLCGKSRSVEPIFTKNPFILVIEAVSHFKIHDIPKELIINKKKYRFLMMTIHQSARIHFISLFELNNRIHFVDDKPSIDDNILDTPISQEANYSQLRASTCIYYLSS